MSWWVFRSQNWLVPYGHRILEIFSIKYFHSIMNEMPRGSWWMQFIQQIDQDSLIEVLLKEWFKKKNLKCKGFDHWNESWKEENRRCTTATMNFTQRCSSASSERNENGSSRSLSWVFKRHKYRKKYKFCMLWKGCDENHSKLSSDTKSNSNFISEIRWRWIVYASISWFESIMVLQLNVNKSQLLNCVVLRPFSFMPEFYNW